MHHSATCSVCVCVCVCVPTVVALCVVHVCAGLHIKFWLYLLSKLTKPGYFYEFLQNGGHLVMCVRGGLTRSHDHGPKYFMGF